VGDLALDDARDLVPVLVDQAHLPDVELVLGLERDPVDPLFEFVAVVVGMRLEVVPVARVLGNPDQSPFRLAMEDFQGARLGRDEGIEVGDLRLRARGQDQREQREPDPMRHKTFHPLPLLPSVRRCKTPAASRSVARHFTTT
jgi:hypothetical protein